jgi:hypothetical protein
MTSPVSPEGQDNYRCPDRGGPDGQRCQLLIEHDPPVHLARIHGAYAGWDDDGTEVAQLPPTPLVVSFPRGRGLATRAYVAVSAAMIGARKSAPSLFGVSGSSIG